MGRRLGVSRNMISTLLRKDKEQLPSRAVTLLFEREWVKAFGPKPVESEINPIQSDLTPETLREDTTAYQVEISEITRARYGCEALFAAFVQAQTPEELHYAAAAFDRAWQRLKTLVEMTRTAHPSCTPSASPAASRSSIPTAPPASIVPLPPQHFMSQEEIARKHPFSYRPLGKSTRPRPR